MKIAVVGSYGVGMTMRMNRVPEAGETLSGAEFSVGPGGKGSNQAIGAARLGADVTLLTAIGSDENGREAMRLWKREGVDSTHVVVVPSLATMVGFIIVDAQGENRIAIASGALDALSESDVESFRGVISGADLLVVSMEIPMPAVLAALRIAHEEGISTLLNPAPASILPDEAWEWIDYLTPNQTEGPVLLGLDSSKSLSPKSVIEELRSRTDATIVLTLAAEGSLLSVGNETRALNALIAPHVVDTTGAGDAFTAALAVAIVEGRSIEQAIQFASAAGAHAVTIEGVIDALPTRSDIDNLIGTHR